MKQKSTGAGSGRRDLSFLPTSLESLRSPTRPGKSVRKREFNTDSSGNRQRSPIPSMNNIRKPPPLNSLIERYRIREWTPIRERGTSAGPGDVVPDLRSPRDPFRGHDIVRPGGMELVLRGRELLFEGSFNREADLWEGYSLELKGKPTTELLLDHDGREMTGPEEILAEYLIPHRGEGFHPGPDPSFGNERLGKVTDLFANEVSTRELVLPIESVVFPKASFSWRSRQQLWVRDR